ncbi:MAG: hypothetical protein QXH21_09700 [Ignisphaera sp.]
MSETFFLPLVVFHDSLSVEVRVDGKKERINIDVTTALRLSSFLVSSVKKIVTSNMTIYKMNVIRLEKALDKIIADAEKAEFISEDEDEALEVLEEMVEEYKNKIETYEFSIRDNRESLENLSSIVNKLTEIEEAIKNVIHEL